MADTPRRETTGDEIAVIGMGGRFPRARDIHEFWRNLRAGVECSVEVTADDLIAAGMDPSALDSPDYVRRTFALEDAEHFDAEYFGFSPGEARMLDPQHRLLLEAAAAALDHAGYDPDRYPGLIAVFGGVGRNSHFMHAIGRDPSLLESSGEYHALIGNERDFPTTHISYRLNLRGPSVDVQTACSTSGVAVHLACQSLRSGECDIALAGGAKVIIPNRVGYWYVDGGPLSPEGRIRAFDAEAKGMARGSGAAMLVLKRLEDAVADGDSVYGVIIGSAVNNDGGAKIGFTAPSVAGQAAVIGDALTFAGVGADDISYVETHGTGTILGDPIEVAGLTDAYRRFTDRTGFCRIGSVKTNIGHLDAAATAAGMIKTLFAFNEEQLPPSLNFSKPNPQIDFESSPFRVNTELAPWPRTEQPRRAGVSSFGLGGTNAHIILEEPPLPEPSDAAAPHQVLVLSARTPGALETASADLARWLRERPSTSLADAAFTLQLGRRELAYRRALVCTDVEQAIDALSSARASRDVPAAGDASVAFVFPGLGSEFAGMAATLCAAEPVFEAALDECLARVDGFARGRVREFLLGSDARAVDHATPMLALFAMSYALGKLWLDRGVRPAAVLGHGVGEIAAATFAGVVGLDDALRLVQARAGVASAAPARVSVGVSLDEDELRALLGGDVTISAVNRRAGPADQPTFDACVVSGGAEAVAELCARLARQGVAVTAARAADAAGAPTRPTADLRAIAFQPPAVALVSSVTGVVLSDAEATDAGYWLRQLVAPVRFADALAALDDAAIVLEVGPGRALANYAGQLRAGRVAIPSARDALDLRDDRAVLAEATARLWTAGCAIEWEALHAGTRRRRIALPTYPFERVRHSLTDGARALPHASTATPVAAAVTEPHDVPAPEPSIEPEANRMIAPAEEPRRGRILEELRAIVEQLSGVAAGQLAPDRTFIELGFDSLFLTRANGAFKSRFKQRLTTRQLMETTPTLDALAGYLDEKLPADFYPPEAPAQTTRVDRVADVPAMPALAGGGADVSAYVQSVIAQQMQLMQEQLAVLRGLGAGTTAGASTSPAPSPAPAASSTSATTAAAPAGAGRPPADKSSPWQPVARNVVDGELTTAQREWLESLIERVTQRTPRSKELTQRNRQRLADPRTVQGFRKRWKEIVYPIVSDSAEGSRIRDIDGNEYIDLVNGYGVTFFGHSAPFILDAARAQLDRTIAIGPQTALAGEVAQLLCDLTGMERAAFCNTGSEAVLAAIRTARTVTGRTKLAMFAGHYHGIFDEVVVKPIGTGPERRAVPTSPGIPANKVEDVVVLEYGNMESLDVIRRHAHDLALVMVEPVRSRNLNLQPVEFLRALRKVTEELEIPLLFDEMVTGFRCHPGGAQEVFGVRADLATYGKIVGGEFPIGVVAGRREFLDTLDGGYWAYGDDSSPEADMTWFAGTFVRHPLALSAARAVLTRFKEEGASLQEGLNRRTATFVRDLNDFFRERNAPIDIEHFSSAFYLNFTSYQEFSPLLFFELHTRGVYTYEGRPAFLTLAHSDADLAHVARSIKEAVAQLQDLGFLSGGAPRAAEPIEIPLSEGQQEIWLATRMGDDASCAYNLGNTLHLKGELRVDALDAALQKLVARHESLRAVPAADGQAQRIAPTLTVPIERHDLSSHDEVGRERALLALRDAEVQTPFDLERGPLVRAKLLRLAADEHLFILTVHHIIADGWSCGLLLRDLAKLYEAESTGRSAALGEPMQLSEFVRHSRENMTSEERAESVQYWMEEYAGDLPVLDLPTDRPRPPLKTFRAARMTVPLEDAFVGRVRQLATSQGATLFSTLLAGYAALLHRLSGQEDIVVGFSLAGQSNFPERDLVGHCVRFLPLRLRPGADLPFAEFTHQAKGKVLDAVEHQNVAFGELLRRLRVPRDPSRIPLMSVAFNLDPSGRPLDFHGLQARSGSVPRRFENFDIFFNFVELGGDSLEIQCTFNLDLYDEETIRQWIGHLEALLDAAAQAPDTALGDLPLTSADRTGDMAGSAIGILN